MSGGRRPAVLDHRHEGDATLQLAQAFSPNATTFLTHLVGGGLADKRYVVQRYKSMLEGGIRPVESETVKSSRRLKRGGRRVSEGRVSPASTSPPPSRRRRQNPDQKSARGRHSLRVKLPSRQCGA